MGVAVGDQPLGSLFINRPDGNVVPVLVTESNRHHVWSNFGDSGDHRVDVQASKKSQLFCILIDGSVRLDKVDPSMPDGKATVTDARSASQTPQQLIQSLADAIDRDDLRKLLHCYSDSLVQTMVNEGVTIIAKSFVDPDDPGSYFVLHIRIRYTFEIRGQLVSKAEANPRRDTP